MPSREPFRTDYIDNLYKNKNIDGLKKELSSINKIIKAYIEELQANLGYSKEILENIKHEQKVKEKILEYLKQLE